MVSVGVHFSILFCFILRLRSVPGKFFAAAQLAQAESHAAENFSSLLEWCGEIWCEIGPIRPGINQLERTEVSRDNFVIDSVPLKQSL